MKKIVCVIRPFTINQNISIYEDTTLIDTINVPIEQIEEKILNLAYEQSINDILLIGSKKFNKKKKEEILKAEMTKYNKNILNIMLSGN